MLVAIGVEEQNPDLESRFARELLVLAPLPQHEAVHADRLVIEADVEAPFTARLVAERRGERAERNA